MKLQNIDSYFQFDPWHVKLILLLLLFIIIIIDFYNNNNNK